MREIVFCIDLYLSAPAVAGKQIIIQIVFFAEMLTLEQVLHPSIWQNLFYPTFIHLVSLDRINK